MNTVMAHVTNSADVQIGDEVVLFGKQAAAEITQREIAQVTVVGAECSRLTPCISDPAPTASNMEAKRSRRVRCMQLLCNHFFSKR